MECLDKGCHHEGMDEIGFLFWRIVKIWRRAHDKILGEWGLTGPQFEILASICNLSLENEEVSQILISSHTLIDPMTTSTTLRNLEKKGLITRKPSKVDTRAVVIEFTEEGDNIFGQAVAKMIESKQRLHKYIDEKVFVDGMRKLLDVLILLEEDNKQLDK